MPLLLHIMYWYKYVGRVILSPCHRHFPRYLKQVLLLLPMDPKKKHLNVCVCVCVRVWERGRVERENMFVCVCETEGLCVVRWCHNDNQMCWDTHTHTHSHIHTHSHTHTWVLCGALAPPTSQWRWYGRWFWKPLLGCWGVCECVCESVCEHVYECVCRPAVARHQAAGSAYSSVECVCVSVCVCVCRWSPGCRCSLAPEPVVPSVHES